MQQRITRRYLVGLLVAGLILALPVMAAAETYETWSGPFSYMRTRIQTGSTRQNLVGSKAKVLGSMEMYVIPNGPPTPNVDGYYLRFVDAVEGFTVGIKHLEFVSTEMIKIGKPDYFQMVGIGEFRQGEIPVGPAYVIIKGTGLKGPAGGMTTIKITSLTLGGGTPDFLWSGKGKATLTKQ